MALWVSSLIGELCNIIRKQFPRTAKYSGIGFYGVCILLAIACIVFGIFGLIQGAPPVFIKIMLPFAVFYWAAGWGLHRALTREDGSERGIQKLTKSSDLSTPMLGNSIKWWKLAASISVLAAMTAPIFTGTLWLSPSEWAFLTHPKEQISSSLDTQNIDSPCTGMPKDLVRKCVKKGAHTA